MREERESCGWPPYRLTSIAAAVVLLVTAAKFFFFSFITCLCYISASDKKKRFLLFDSDLYFMVFRFN